MHAHVTCGMHAHATCGMHAYATCGGSPALSAVTAVAADGSVDDTAQ
jgi:hypothetical protein